MLKLSGKFTQSWDRPPSVLRVATARSPIASDSVREAFLLTDECTEAPFGFQEYLGLQGHRGSWQGKSELPIRWLPNSFTYLSEGDILAIHPESGSVWVVYRRNSPSNSMLLTERCNSYCLMCSQPPKEGDDSHLADVFLDAIPLMSKETVELGITGGEPGLLGVKLLDLVRSCEEHLPQTSVHMLTNGRLFQDLDFAQDLSECGHHDLMLGIPLYSDIPWRHDFVVQANGAFDETIRGILNLARCGVRIEIRVVLNRQTVNRLPGLARFIARNLPFVEHVALMGLEMMGFVRMNLESLWIDPVDYQDELLEAVRILDDRRMNVSIYNHQLCTLDRHLWPFARKSISDWKNEYQEMCEHCSARKECGGFFASSTIRYSRGIHPLSESDLTSEPLASGEIHA